jgi:hypothetical protein
MKLVDLVTDHPGGWADILEGIKTLWPDLTIDVAQALWGSTNKVRDRKGEEQATLVFRLEKKGEDRRRYLLHEYLGGLEHRCGGMLAAEAIRCLERAGLPVPGDEQWSLYAADWERRDAGY